MRVVWTLFNCTATQRGCIHNLVKLGHAHFVIYQDEISTQTQRKHLQGYTEFKQALRWNAIKKLIGTDQIHLAVARGTTEQCIAYCSKQDSRDPNGQQFQEGVPTLSQGARNDMDDCKEIIDRGGSMKELAQAHFSNYVRYYKGFQQYQHLVATHRTRNTISILIWGVSNSRKTGSMKEVWPEAMTCWLTKGNNGWWWDEYDGHEIVIFDEIEPGDIDVGLFKRLIDGSPMTVDTKGSRKPFTAGICVFISNHNPGVWFKNVHHSLFTDHEESLVRRFHICIQACKRITVGNAWDGTYAMMLRKCVFPWNAYIYAQTNWSGLTHEQTKMVFDISTDASLRSALRAKCGIKWVEKSEGVILTPSLLDEPVSFFDQCTVLIGQLFGWDDPLTQVAEEIADDPPQLPPPSPQHVPAAEPATSITTRRPVRHDQALKPSVFRSNYPELTWDDVDAIKTKRTASKIKRTRKRRSNPYIDDEAIESECDNTSHTETQPTSSLDDFIIDDDEELNQLLATIDK